MWARGTFASVGLVTFLSLTSLVACGGDDGGSTNDDGGGNAAGEPGTGGGDGTGGSAVTGGSGGAASGGNGSGGAAVDECEPNPCVHGTCTGEPGDGTTSCDCDAGYEGATCDVDTDECAAMPCKNGGTCAEGDIAEFTCTCPDGFGGPTCEWTEACFTAEYSSLLVAECPPGHIIMDVTYAELGDLAGSCQDGFTEGTCGFPGLLAQADMYCVGQGDCIFLVDAGQDDPCPNTDKFMAMQIMCGASVCGDGIRVSPEECDDGNTLDGDDCPSDCNLDACQPNPCSNGGTCTDGVQELTCECPDGWTGKLCEESTSICGNAPEGQEMFLQCPAGTVIKDITFASYGQPQGGCGQGEVLTVGSCHAPSSQTIVEANCLGKDTCLVPVDWMSLGEDPCPNQAKWFSASAECEAPVCGDGVLTSDEECDDGNNVNGDGCEGDCSEDACAGENPCQNDGLCYDQFRGFSCGCFPGTSGELCQNTDPCDPNPCGQNEQCWDLGDGSHECTCPDGYFGDNCVPGDCAGGAEYDFLELGCAAGQVITSVDFASYGTPSGLCGDYGVEAGCDAATSVSVVEAQCLGKQTCSVHATNVTFGDPCEGTNKWMYAQVACGTP